MLVGGSLGDLHGRRRIFAIGTAGFGAASLICAVAPTIEVLVAARALQGAFGALLVPSSLAIITSVFGPGERAAAIGSWTAGTSAAIALGPPLGGLLVDALSWRVIFAMNVPLVLVCLWLIARHVPECPGDRTHRIDVPGAVLCALGLAGPVYALIQQPVLGWSDPEVWAPLVGGIGAFGAFVAYERRAPDPMLPPAIFRSRNFAVGNVVTFVVYAGLGAATFFIALFLQQVAGYSAFEAGLVAAADHAAARDARAPLRRAVGARRPAAADDGRAAAVRARAAAVRPPGRARGLRHAACCRAPLVFGLGLAVTVAPLTATVLQAADRRHAGIASGVNNAVARVASLIAIAAVGAVVSAQFSARIDERLPARGDRRADAGVPARGRAPAADGPARGGAARACARRSRRPASTLPDRDGRHGAAHDRRRDRSPRPASRTRAAASRCRRDRAHLTFPGR